MVSARIFPNAEMTNHFAVITWEILSVTEDFAGRTKEILLMMREIFLMTLMLAGKTRIKLFVTVQTLTFY